MRYPRNRAYWDARSRGYWKLTEPGERLRVARIAAGFTSGRAAAFAFGWPDSTFRAHEAGTRAIAYNDGKRYARAFNVTPEWLLEGYGPPPDGIFKEQLGNTWQRQLLKLARRLCGFRTGAEAVEFFGWRTTTYYAHERGVRLTAHFAKIYGAAFGVSPDWLRRGELPSGLGTDVDRLLKASPSLSFDNDAAIIDYLAYVDSTRRGDIWKVNDLSGPPSTLIVAQLQPADVACEFVLEWTTQAVACPPEDARMRGVRAPPAWGFPVGFLQHVWHVNSRDLKVVPLEYDYSPAGLKRGGRLVVDVADRAPSSTGLFLVLSGTAQRMATATEIVRGDEVLGRVVGVVTGISTEPLSFGG